MTNTKTLTDPDKGDEQPNEIALDACTREYISDLQKQISQIQDRAMVAMQTALELEVRRNKLKGAWKISEDGTKIIRDDSKTDSNSVTR